MVLGTALSATLLSAGCAKSYVSNTDVEDTGENRKVLVFCEKYRRAVEEKDVGELLKLASPKYYEDGGNARPDDDYDYEGLRDFLLNQFAKTSGIRYEIRYRKVSRTETNRVLVDYTFSTAYRIPGAEKEEWRHKVADNRLELVADGDTFKIMSGM